MSILRVSLFFLAPSAHAALSLTLSEGPNDSVTLEISASGTVTASPSNVLFLVFGTTDDSFLRDGETGASDPSDLEMQLGIFTATEHLYRDNNGGLGLQSYFEFDFPAFNLPVGALNLADLNGTYQPANWQFSDFQPGTYTLTTASANPAIFTGSGLSQIQLTVVPEPTSISFLFLGSFAVLIRKRNVS